MLCTAVKLFVRVTATTAMQLINTWASLVNSMSVLFAVKLQLSDTRCESESKVSVII
jgi:hypothetical protein